MDLSDAAWRTSSYSGGNGGQCVEVATVNGRQSEPDGVCLVRDSKDPGGPVLAFGPGQWRLFTAGVKPGGSAWPERRLPGPATPLEESVLVSGSAPSRVPGPAYTLADYAVTRRPLLIRPFRT